MFLFYFSSFHIRDEKKDFIVKIGINQEFVVCRFRVNSATLSKSFGFIGSIDG